MGPWLHWEEGEDTRGRPVWLCYLECGHWGLIYYPERSRIRFYMPRIPWRKSPIYSDCTS